MVSLAAPTDQTEESAAYETTTFALLARQITGGFLFKKQTQKGVQL
jgi:hypothetical protein